MNKVPTPHNGASIKDVAPIVFLPGDPTRAAYLAGELLESPRPVNTTRNCLGYTGTYLGKRVTIQASGMGQPSLGIYVAELIQFYGVTDIIRLGSCGVFDKNVELNSIIICEEAITNSNIALLNKSTEQYALGPIAGSDKLLKKVLGVKRIDSSVQLLAGRVLASDLFYFDKKDWWKKIDPSCICVDMETFYLYCLGKSLGVDCLTLNLAVDNLETGEELPSEERVTHTIEMAEFALDSFLK